MRASLLRLAPIVCAALGWMGACSRPAPPADFPPVAWEQCEADADCVIVGGGCARGAVNRKVRDEAEREYRQRAMTQNCVITRDGTRDRAGCGRVKQPCRDASGAIDHASTCLSATPICHIVPADDARDGGPPGDAGPTPDAPAAR